MPAPCSTRTRAAIAVGAALAAALTGCSSDSTDAAAPTGPAKVAPPAILQAGTLKVCAANDGTPPSVYHDETGALVGSEVDLAKALAGQLGLKPDFVESAFTALIPTLQAKQCDVIMAQLYIKPEREKVVDFVPYVYSGTGIAVSKEHPAAITGMDDSLCGKKVIVAIATTAEEQVVNQSATCTAAGKPEIDITRNSHADVALQQVQNGQVDAYLDTAETLGYYATKTGAQIQLAGKPFGTIKIGAATLKGDTALHDAITQALGELEANGTYAKILADWGQTDLDIQK
ncbi:ABC transporter substrate-binding protein [Mycolicibacterium rhodesiae]|uniref:ABC transporter substrate-binding protein n=1 Tax=Mycolicibacterium rhodesiae TaxID=36814 RepID=A0A1X0INS3_MYCRH|nr:ABC transporter substrate-binding protein [Mycolicibacterium rhodesiae]MCV7347460.1 ABC transporter substrate-binding protein [Mycolicibacterium rhodesiae]ORB49751.1 ABC transporter substrate-binding protein [Mycolicibacterium rhodesiae]